MAIETTPLGFQKPDGNELVRNGDNAIAANAQTAEVLLANSRGRLVQLEDAAGFSGTGIDLADAVVNPLIDTATATRAKLDARYANKADTTTALAGKVSKGALVLNVRDYGATGNGTTDDTAAIQSTLDAAYAAPGSVVRIPAGTYKITATLRVRKDTTIDATGARINGYWSDTGGTNLVCNGYPGDSYPGYTGNGNITITGGIWDSRGPSNGVNLSNGMAMGHAERLTFRNLTIKNLSQGHGFDLSGCRNVIIEGVRFEGATHSGSEAVQIDIMAPGAFPTFGPYDLTQTKDVIVQGCYFGPSDVAGPWARGVGSHSARIDRPYTNINVTGNNFACNDAAVRAYNWGDSVISSNNVDGAGIYILPISTGAVEDTKLADGTQTGASIAMKNIVVSNNRIGNASLYGMYLSGTPTGQILNCVVTGNIVNGSVNYAYRCTETYDTIFSNNSAVNSGASSVSFSGNARCLVANNVSKNSAGDAFTIYNCLDFNVIGNTIVDAAGHGISVSGTTGGSGFGSIKNNTIIGSSKAANNTSNGIQISLSDSYQVIGNKIRKNPANSNHAKYGLAILSAAVNTHHTLNDARLSSVTASISDTGTTSTTVSTNLA